MIGIRSDANMTIASGHIMRCLTIASELNKLGVEITLFTADHDADDLINNYSASNNGLFHHLVLNTDWQDMEGELALLTECLQVRNIRTLLVDSYQVTYDYFKALSRVCKLVYLDDLHVTSYPVDMIINYNGYALDMNYESDYVSKKLLLGLQYAPLRPQFYEDTNVCSDIPQREDRYNILLASGGGDRLGCMAAVLKEVSKRKCFEYLDFHVIIGSLAGTRDDLDKLADKYSNIILHESVTNMAEIMRSCHIALTAAGTMITECAACRLPAVFFITADNQKYETDYWKKNELMIYGGDMTGDYESAVISSVDSLELLINSPDRLSKMRLGLKTVTDGKGALRIAREIKKLCEQQ